MSRKTHPVSEIDLPSPTKRAKLLARHRPYWSEVARGTRLGYRKSDRDKVGIWYARHFVGGSRGYEQWKIGPADDRSTAADNNKILSHQQATVRALKGKPDAIDVPKDPSGYLVSHAIAEYLAYLKTDRRSYDDTKVKLAAYVPKKLQQTPIADLTHDILDKWRTWTLTHKPAGRKDWPKAMRRAQSIQALDAEYDHAVSHFGKLIPPKVAAAFERRIKELNGLVKQRKYGPASTKPKPQPKVVDVEEARRKKKATVNRIITSVKAAMNRAYDNGRVASDAAWKRIEKFEGVDSSRLRWLTPAEITRLGNVCDPPWRKVVHAAVQTGARWSELRRAKVRDYDPTSGKLQIPKSKNQKARWIPLTDEGCAFFDSITAGREPDAPLLPDESGKAWGKAAQIRKMEAATQNAKLVPRATFHTLRHTYASLLVQAGTPLIIVAGAMGHKDTRMVEKTYGHLAPTSISDAVRANLPKFGIAIETKVVRIRA
jgi:integrase